MTLRLLFCILWLLVNLSGPKVFAQSYNPTIDVQHYLFALRVSDQNNIITGDAAVTLVLKPPADSFQLDLSNINSEGKGMKVLSVKENGRPVKFTHTHDNLIIHISPASRGEHTYEIRYEGIPADGLIISN